MATRKTTLALMLALAACSRGKSPPTEGPQPRIERADDPVPYQYLVVLKPGGGASADVARELIASHDASVLRSYDRALRGFAMHASEETAVAIARDPRVAWVAEDGRVKAQAIAWQENAPAGLDRIDQRTGTNGRYGYHDAAGERVHAYVLDTGILASHLEFLARPPEQVDFVRDGGIGDCNGHGTYVAALVGGTTWGAAKKVTLHSLRVLGCDAAGTTSDAVAALDWLLANAQTPAVANLSFGRGGDAALDAAVAAVVAAGIPVVVAAGDAGRDACATSPARVPGALTVAATDPTGGLAAGFSNHGPCVDLFAPGVDVRSASIRDAAGSLTHGESFVASGTSASAPFVTGAVALYLARYTGATPDEVARALFANSTRAPATLPAYTPDRFLFTTFVDDDNSADTERPSVTLDTPASGVTVSGPAVAVTATASDDVGVTRVELFASGRFIASCEASPCAFTWDSTREPNGTATLVARAYDAAGNATDSAPVPLTVANAGIAHFDAALGAPRCETVAPVCDSVDLLAGRAEIGPERNAPNVLTDACPTAANPAALCTCADGPFGKYALDESIEQITVTTLGGGQLATGADVEVAVRVYVGSTYFDTLDLYSSPTVAPPAWRHLGSVQAAASGLQTLAGRFTLPVGSPQAVRAAFRHGGMASTCTDGGFDERDDLAFVVASGTPDATPPTGVAITSPRAGEKVSGPITVTATATDDHLVNRVEFTVDSILIGADVTAPYSANWNSGLVPNGTYAFRATAYDGAGNVTVSDPVSVVIKDETPPVVAITSPTTGTQVASTPLVVKAAATDNGVVKKVELWECRDPCDAPPSFYAADTTEPYEFSWSRPNGAYQLFARAQDGAGLTTDSARILVQVGDTNPPTCSVKAPQSTIVVGDVLLEAEAVDDTEVAQVEFYRVGVAGRLGLATTPPYTAIWNSGPLVNGPYEVYCVATDTSKQTTPDPRHLTLTVNDTRVPTFEIVSPPVTHDPPNVGAVVSTPVSGVVLVQAGASDDGAVRQVEFYLDDPPVLLATVSSAPWAFSWNSGSIANGTHTLTAKAYDYNAHDATSAPLQITTNDGTAPTVAILFPVSGATVTGVVPVRAQVADPGGVVVKVELFDGDTLVTTSTAAPGAYPYEFIWTTDGATLGPHTLTVKATDFVGNVGTASVAVVAEATSATYDPALRVPVCASERTRCQSSLLLDGRGALGPEVNASNNLPFACPTASDPAAKCQCVDGDAGVYHGDESIDFISVSARDGANLTGGRVVDVEVRAWIFDPQQDRVALFYAADATNPVWVALPHVQLSPDAGPQTVRTSYTLPHGLKQAFRASVRFGSADAAACVPGEYNDHDDLVFAVAPAPDATPPAIALTAPADAAPVTGVVTIAANASDDVGVASVTFLADGAVVGTDYTSPYTWSWDTHGLVQGVHELEATAEDFAGNVTTSAAVSVTVSDSVRPTVALTAPMAAETVNGTVTLAAVAADDLGVVKVEFYVDGQILTTDEAAPYAAAWNTAVATDELHTIVAVAYDAAGNTASTAPVTVLVSNTGNASFDHQLAIPACARAATKCFSGTLLDGRGPLGPEPNAPNTVNAICTDGSQGTYHVDESIDAITVRSPSGTLTAGGTAVVEVKIWATQAFVMDALDIYYTADAAAASPVWQYHTTVAPDRAGAQVLTASYKLPAGTRQAVRTQLRFGGGFVANEPTLVCGEGTFDDRDDLAFEVSP